jgi:pSer/pThr/pTyr-binding forkhead associated (FHA) protein
LAATHAAGDALVGQQERGRLAVIVVQADGQRPALFLDRFTIGRRGCDLLIDDDFASAPHAEVWPSGGDWLAADCGSMNGSYLNGQRFYGPVALVKGDKLRVGRTVITVVPE